MRIFGPASVSSACHLHRILLPFRHLQNDAPQHQWDIGLSDPSGPYDVLYCYGSQPLNNAPEIASLKFKGVKIVYTIDDSFWSWAPWRHDVPTKESRGMVELLCELADHIVVSTPFLAEEIGRPHKTTVAPNLMDVKSYGCPTPPDDDRIRIMWSGAAAHKGDLELIDGACCRVLEKYGPEKLEFQFVGAGPDRCLRDWWGIGANLTDWFPLNHYAGVIRQVRPTIALAPLADCGFNRAKSGIRCLEAHCVNAALVYTPLAEYAAVNEAGVTGLPASTEDEWFAAICRLVEDKPLREKLATEAYSRVKAEWDWNSVEARQKWAGVASAIDELF